MRRQQMGAVAPLFFRLGSIRDGVPQGSGGLRPGCSTGLGSGTRWWGVLRQFPGAFPHRWEFVSGKWFVAFGPQEPER